MSMTNAFLREAKFMVRDRALLIWTFVVLSFSIVSVWSGLVEVRQQHATIERLIEADQEEHRVTSSKVKSWGSAAYYNFHLTYDLPSSFAFAAMGQRDLQPWKHRIRMLALEGQIYERDAGNPVITLVGRFDFAFLAAFILPLVLIILLYDLRASERSAGRHDLLEATAGQALSFWFVRTCIRVSAILVSLIVPMIFAGVIAGSPPSTLIWGSVLVFTYAMFWTLLCYVIAAWRKPSNMILMALVGIWLSLAVVLPASARFVIDRVVTIPSGADILLLQRETVNDAWDLPKEATMEAFFAAHPEWSDYKAVESSFEWPWYYAFQQVGDQRTKPLTIAYRDGRAQRDKLATWISFLAPPSLLERTLQALAKTDVAATIAYENQVRAFHKALRTYYYPRFFRNATFEKSDLDNLPKFKSTNDLPLKDG